jgi:hypothetical protein
MEPSLAISHVITEKSSDVSVTVSASIIKDRSVENFTAFILRESLLESYIN